jgi:flagellar biosynthesis anti-sigma factor FlgM
MKIDTLSTPNSKEKTRTINSANRTTQANSIVSSTTTNNAADTINISSQAGSVSRLSTQARQAPEIRQERVNFLRTLISAGEFRPKSEDIADAIIRDTNAKTR